MIVVTVGTNEQPFDRLVAAAAQLPEGEPRFVQYGSSVVAHGSGVWVDFVSFEELAARMQDARVVVCHAGVGSIMLALRAGRRPVVVPRLLRLGEAVDDHQLPLARRLHDRGIVTLVEDATTLAEAVTAGAIGAHGAIDRSTPDLRRLPGAAVLSAELGDHLTELGVLRHGGVPSAAPMGGSLT